MGCFEEAEALLFKYEEKLKNGEITPDFEESNLLGEDRHEIPLEDDATAQAEPSSKQRIEYFRP